MTANNSETKHLKTIKLWHIVVGILLIVVVWASSGAFLFWRFDDPSARGAFGDMFGFINSLFSGLAFAGLIVAIILQKQELTETRNALLLQKDEMVDQNKTMAKQSFESTFFQLLRLHGDIVNSMEFTRPGDQNNIKTSGKRCFKVFTKRYAKIHNGRESMSPKSQNMLAHIEATYQDFYNENQSNLGHYFRSLYHIIKLIDKSEIEDKHLYTSLTRAQLSSFELTLLFYNCLSFGGREKFKPLVERYALLKNLDPDLIIKEYHMKLFEPSAFE